MSFVLERRGGETQGAAARGVRAALLAELRAVLGEAWVDDDPCILDTYAWQYLAEAMSDTHYMPRPICVVLPADTRQVAAVVRLCNRFGVQYKAMSTGFGAWNAPMAEDTVVQIDLRRLDRILQIDADNMYAVVEPYVTGNQLQTEAMKVGLNTHIAGCGAQCSVLASATSMMGQGWDGISMGFSNRNLLGFEWVTPDGRVVQVGSFDASGADFAGDGPGYSVRGIVRGFAGALGGLGVFTRAAVKLYPWEGPAALEVAGASPDYFVEIPEHHAAALLVVRDWRGMAELGQRIGEAEICSHFGRNAPALMAGVLTVDNNEAVELYGIPMIHELYYSVMIVTTARHAGEAAWKRGVLHAILDEVGGGMLGSDTSLRGGLALTRAIRALASHAGVRAIAASARGLLGMMRRDIGRWGARRLLDVLPQTMYQSLLRSHMNMRGVFRFAGTFWTSMGALVTWDNAIRGARVGAQVKRKYIASGTIVDDGADNAWGGLYEGGAYAHLEELALYDQTDPRCREGVVDFIIETNLACIENHCGDSLNAVGPPNHALYSPACMDYDKYTARIKRAFDPNDASDGSAYCVPGFLPDTRGQQAMARVLADRAPVRVDNDHVPAAGGPRRDERGG